MKVQKEKTLQYEKLRLSLVRRILITLLFSSLVVLINCVLIEKFVLHYLEIEIQKVSARACKYKSGARTYYKHKLRSRAGKYTFGARAGKHELGARASKYKLEVRADKYKLRARADKYKLGARASKY